jgi:heat shock protein HslJ
MNRVNKIIIVLGCLLFCSGCISASQQFELSGTRWILQSMHGQELLEDTAITLKITEREISGSAGCNLYFSRYTTQPKNRIEIGEVANTDRGCETASKAEQEKEYINTIQKATSYSIDGENLFIADKQGNTLLQFKLLLIFEANPEGLVGKTWRLIYADGMEAYELEAFTLWFEGSTFGGTTSCRDYEGTYQTDEAGIRARLYGMTTVAECDQIEQRAEGTYTSFFTWIDQYNVSKNQLELYTMENDKLIYELVPEK